jgi:ankyrin repeat protein
LRFLERRKTMLHIIPLLTALVCVGNFNPTRSQKPAKTETVMTYGMKITATTKSGTMTITAGDGYSRAYTWKGATRTEELGARGERWYGSLGIASPGAGEHWKEHDGVTHAVLEEGQQHFKTLALAQKWIRSRGYLPYVYNDTGLFVEWGKTGGTGLDVDVWQLYINGKKPSHLPGSNNSAIKVNYEKRPGAPTTLADAVRQGNLGAVKALLNKGADPNAKNNIGTPVLLLAVKHNNLSIVQALLGKGADANALDAEGSPALHVAVRESSLPMVKALLAAKANVNATTKRGMTQGITALILAAMSEGAASLPMARTLLDAGANPKVSFGPLGWTALHLAAQQGNKPVVDLLLTRGVPVNIRDQMGGTALMDAAKEGHKEIVALLIQHGANVNAKTDETRRLYGKAWFVGDKAYQKQVEKSGRLKTLHEDGSSALEYAKTKEIAEMLKKAGAKK